MPWIKINGSRMLFLLTFSLLLVSSCQKDQVSNNGTIEETPITVTPPIDKDSPKYQMDQPSTVGNLYADYITDKEVYEIIQMKELLRILIKESLIQLFFNHDFNPLMPEINTRVACVTCSQTDCGCPFQDPSTNPNPNTYPKTISLKYYDSDAANCTCTLATSPSGLQVTGEMIIEFSADFTTAGHTIKLYPQADFVVDGHDIDGTEIEITQSGSSLDSYKITNVDNISVTKNGDVTLATSISDKSRVTITDVNNNHGSIENAFGLLDDIFNMSIRTLEIHCSNGAQVHANSASGEDLVYDMACENIQDGMIILSTIPVGPGFGETIVTYDYGAPATGSDPGVCDDIVSVTYPATGD